MNFIIFIQIHKTTKITKYQLLRILRGEHLLPIHHHDCMPAANRPQYAYLKHAESASRRRGRLAKPTHPHREGRGAPWGTGCQIRLYKTTRSGDQFVMSLFVCALRRSALPLCFPSFNHFDGFMILWNLWILWIL